MQTRINTHIFMWHCHRRVCRVSIFVSCCIYHLCSCACSYNLNVSCIYFCIYVLYQIPTKLFLSFCIIFGIRSEKILLHFFSFSIFVVATTHSSALVPPPQGTSTIDTNITIVIIKTDYHNHHYSHHLRIDIATTVIITSIIDYIIPSSSFLIFIF